MTVIPAATPAIEIRNTEIGQHVARATKVGFLPKGFDLMHLIDFNLNKKEENGGTVSAIRLAQLPTGNQIVNLNEYHVRAPDGNEHHSVTRTETLTQAGKQGGKVQMFTVGNFYGKGRIITASRFPVDEARPWLTLSPENEVRIVTDEGGRVVSLTVGKNANDGSGFDITFSGNIPHITTYDGKWDTREVWDSVKTILGFDPRNEKVNLQETAANMLTMNMIDADQSLPAHVLPKYIATQHEPVFNP